MAAASSLSRPGTSSPASAALVSAPHARAGTAHSTHVGRLRRSLRACTAEGLVAEVVSACAGGAILTGWAIHLHASALVTGLILSLSQVAQLFQIPAAWTTSRFGHRRACLWLVGASRQALLPLILLPFLPLSDSARQGVLLSVAAVSAVLGVLGNNAWVSWMSELVPKRVRGRYFGKRTALCTLGGALAAAGAGVLLDHARARDLAGPALALLQLIACAAGVVTIVLMLRQHDPGPAERPTELRLVRALAPLGDRSMRGVFFYLAAWNAAVGLAGSFFSLHMLRNLKMGFTLVALHGTALALVRMVAAPIWGSLLDRLGARPVLLACSFGISTIPFIWLFPTEHSLAWPLALDCLVAGVLWCGHGLANFNLPLSISPRAERPFYLASFSMVSGLAFSVATLAGGLLAEALPDRFELAGRTVYDLQVLFVLSGVLRLAAAFVALRIEEPEAKDVGALWAAIRGGSGRVRSQALAMIVPSAATRALARSAAANDNARLSTASGEHAAPELAREA